MLQLHFYSNHAGRLILGNKSFEYIHSDIYPLESIKEFDDIPLDWRRFLADLLRKGGGFGLILVKN